MGTFTRIFGTGDKDLQEKADELLLKLTKGIQSASAKLCVASKVWVEGEGYKLKEIQDEIIGLEREMDAVKEDLIENVLAKGAFLPQQSLERHTLIIALDKVLDAAENAVRVMTKGERIKPPSEIRELGRKAWMCTDLLQDCVKFLLTDFAKAVDTSRSLDIVREETRDVQFELLGKLYANPDYRANELLLFQTVSERIVLVVQKAEDASDFIRELAVKYS
jgi:predicted phosphate transport protein (TIGR00153 family)